MDFFQAALIAVFFILISLATKTHFRSKKFPPGMIVVSGLSIIGVANCLYQLLQRPASDFWPFLFVGAAYILFFWAIRTTRDHDFGLAFDTAKTPTTVVTTGPFRLTRHPFNVSYGLYWVGVAAVSNNGWGVFISGTLLFLYVLAARREEKLIINSYNGDEYVEYQKRTIF